MKHSPIDLFYQAEDYFFRSISKECLDFDNLTTAYYSGVDCESDNPVYIRKHIEAIDEVLNRCQHFYKTHHSPWTVIVTEQYISNNLEQALKFSGFAFSGKSVAMYLELNKQCKIDIPENIRIHLVNDKLDLWLQPLIEAFDLTFEVMRQYADAHERALKNNINVDHYTLFKEEQPICSLTVSRHANVARIHDVGTLPAYQGKGFATYLVKHAINEAIKLGANHCVLEASEAGIAVYEKLGFKSLFKNMAYSLSASE